MRTFKTQLIRFYFFMKDIYGEISSKKHLTSNVLYNSNQARKYFSPISANEIVGSPTILHEYCYDLIQNPTFEAN